MVGLYAILFINSYIWCKSESWPRVIQSIIYPNLTAVPYLSVHFDPLYIPQVVKIDGWRSCWRSDWFHSVFELENHGLWSLDPIPCTGTRRGQVAVLQLYLDSRLSVSAMSIRNKVNTELRYYLGTVTVGVSFHPLTLVYYNICIRNSDWFQI